MKTRDIPLKLAPKLKAIMAQEYPRFSDAEYARRHKALGAVMEKAGVDHLLVITDTRAGNAPQWVTGWPGTVEAYVIFKPGEKMWMSVEWVNHYPLARKIARDVEVHWGVHHGLQQMIQELRGRLAGTRQGVTERELGAIVESAYIKHGGTTMIHYMGVTSMAHPHIYVPPQHHSPRKVKKGDVVFCELSAYWWDYAGQVRRTFTVCAGSTL